MSDIFDERAAFNFYKSYYKTSLLLDSENRAEFLDCILHYQFTGELKEPKLPFASLAFNGQIHSLQKQVNGYIKGKKTYPTGNPTKGDGKANDKGKGKEVQDKEKEKDKEKDKDKEKEQIPPTPKGSEIDFDKLLKAINHYTGKNLRVINAATKKKFKDRLKDGYSKEEISKAIKNASKDPFHIEKQFQYLTPEYFSRAATIDKFASSIAELPKQQPKVIPGPWNV